MVGPLPTYFAFVPESPQILSSTLHLDGAGHASLTEHRIQMAGGDVTATNTYDYVIAGNTIQFKIICPIDAICAAPPIGHFLGSKLFLDMSGGGNEKVIYSYDLTS